MMALSFTLREPQMTRLFNFGLLAVATALLGCGTPPPSPTGVAPVATDFIACTMQAAGASYKGTCEVTCSVNALAVNFDGLEPKRACTGALRKVQVELGKTAVAGKWLGTMQGVQPEDPTRFEVVSVANSNVGRTPFGWFDIIEMKESPAALSIKMNADRQVRPTAADIAIISRAIALLPNESVWNKNDNRQCPAGQSKISMFCALAQATTEISGGIHYRQPAAQAVREALNGVDAKRIKTHRIMDFNNHPDTTLAEIHAVLGTARARLQKDIR
jgi:very-short-patch-repair endonuclease